MAAKGIGALPQAQDSAGAVDALALLYCWRLVPSSSRGTDHDKDAGTESRARQQRPDSAPHCRCVNSNHGPWVSEPCCRPGQWCGALQEVGCGGGGRRLLCLHASAGSRSESRGTQPAATSVVKLQLCTVCSGSSSLQITWPLLVTPTPDGINVILQNNYTASGCFAT